MELNANSSYASKNIPLYLPKREALSPFISLTPKKRIREAPNTTDSPRCGRTVAV